MQRDINVIGIDIAKRVCHVIGMDTRGKILLRKRLYRGEVVSFMAQLPRATVGMEACGGDHYKVGARTASIWLARWRDPCYTRQA